MDGIVINTDNKINGFNKKSIKRLYKMHDGTMRYRKKNNIETICDCVFCRNQKDKWWLIESKRIEVKKQIKVRLVIPEKDLMSGQPAKLNGEHFDYHNQIGVVLCGAGNGGVWVKFDSQHDDKYVGCPIKWLSIIVD